MMKKYGVIFCILFTSIAFSQTDSLIVKDSLQVIDKKYLEDQLYFAITYNVLSNQPESVNDSGFSFGLSGGFIKDVPLNEKRNFALGFGLGYGFDSYNHGLKILENNNQFSFEAANSLTSNKLIIHNIEFPLEIRWRNSTPKRYEFWRVYAGIKITYNFSNKFEYVENGNKFTFNSLNNFNTWQTGLTISAGYDAFNLHFYYGFSPILKNAAIGTTNIDTKVLKFGLIFYIL